MYNNPENINHEEIIRKLENLTKGIILVFGQTKNRCERIKVLESYGYPIKITKEEWIKKFVK